MVPSKRLFDLVVAAALIIALAPVIAMLSLLIRLIDGKPVFYVSERMKTPDEPFDLVKFRSMVADAGDSGVTGGDKRHRYSRFGGLLRRHRLDEVPQLWNVLVGDMSFVGPRPPLRQYVEMFPALYAQVLEATPGITGMASVCYSRQEEELLSQCLTQSETDRVYRDVCIPAKAALDVGYAARRSLWGDIKIMARTVLRSER